jgi:hypothetical protein
MLVIGDKEVSYRRTKERSSSVVPGHDGRYLFTLDGIFSNVLERGRRMSDDPYLLPVPAVHGDLYLTLDLGRTGAPPPTGAHLHLAGQKEALARFDNLEWPTTQGAVDLRLFLIPAARTIITIPPSNDRLVFHRFDLPAILRSTKADYLFVESVPPLHLEKGEELSYQVAVRSKRGGVKYRLESGPFGMSVSPQGLLTWKSPPGGTEAATDVILHVSDQSDKEVLHAFRLGHTPKAKGIGVFAPAQSVK